MKVKSRKVDLLSRFHHLATDDVCQIKSDSHSCSEFETFYSFSRISDFLQSEFQRAGGGASADLHPVKGGLWFGHRDPSGATHTHRPPAPQLHPLGGGPH